MLGPLSTGMVDSVRGSTAGAEKSVSLYNQSPRSTQPGHPSMGRRNEYQPKSGDALQLGSQGRYGLCVWQVKLCDPLAIMGHI